MYGSEKEYSVFGKSPFIIPILLLILAYSLSTFFSVARFVSWWGSYQRLQGTYTFLSYVVISLMTMAHLRRPEQIRRLQHVIIVTSLPIAIYGVIQHYAIDPLPWGGDVTKRVAGNAGNAIFLAAYLIMAIFFTFERIYSSFTHLLNSDGSDNRSEAQDMPSAIAGGAYLFILMVQLLAVFWTQSRGPLLGILLGIYLFGLLLFSGLRPRGFRIWTLSWIGVGFAGIIFLILLNTTAVANIFQSIPSLARLSTLLDLESNTAQVRILIWQGAADMMTPHEPLIYPDGNNDAINLLRPLVGYGPEAMWVAYNPFYPPRLAHHERRNASPDRSHNETWDALVITGTLGFVAYMALFLAVFYWALRWLRLIVNQWDTILFSSVLTILSLIFIFVFYLFDGGWRFLGVALPAGMMLGLAVYVTIAVFLHPDLKPEQADLPRQLLIIALVSTFAAHFVEIHFGIAIAATRTYFWIQVALLLALGMRWVQAPAFAAVAETGMSSKTTDGAPAKSNTANRKRRTRRSNRESDPRRTGGDIPSVPATVMTDILIFLTFVFIYTTNSQGLDQRFDVLWSSITSRLQSGEVVQSPALLFLMIFTWVIAATLGLAAQALSQRQMPNIGWWLRGYGLHAAIIWIAWLIYGLVQGGRLIPNIALQAFIDRQNQQPLSMEEQLNIQLEHVAGHFQLYTWILVAWLFAAGTVYAWPYFRQRFTPVASRLAVSSVIGTLIAVVVFITISTVNIALVRADIIYKQGQQFDSQRSWLNSIELYRRALAARETEDHYMLFLGRSLLEHAKQTNMEGTVSLGSNPTVDDVLNLNPDILRNLNRVELLRAAEVVLKEAQRVNPLNTDHTANLARLYRTWADLSDDPDVRQEKLDQSLAQYEMAMTLSPNAAHLWNEKGNAHLARQEMEQAEEVYLYSLSLDPLYDQTYLLLADYYDRDDQCEQAIQHLEEGIRALEESKRHRPSLQMFTFLGVAMVNCNNLQGAIDANLRVIDRDPNNIGASRNLMILYRDIGDIENSIIWGERTISVTSPDNVQQILQVRQFLVDLYQSTEQTEQIIEQYELMRQVAPTNLGVLSQLYNRYLEQNNLAKIVEVLEALIAADPSNYQYPLDLARRLGEQGEMERARQFAQQALEIAPAEQQSAIRQLITALNGE
ncbi:O-antigen ligase family protein [Chloroflexi bacterium TSY]|nr:O-antigen ligase family protein [Chloroflexi bacterium TSY]